MQFDTIVIGMGPAGISAAIYLKRFGNNVLVLGKDFGTLGMAKEIENYYGMMPTTGKEIAEAGLKQAAKLEVLINHDEVLAIEYMEKGFKVIASKGTYEAKTIFIATGKSRNTLTIAKAYEGRGVSYCATCDGFFYRGKNLALIGYNEYMAHELEHLLPLAKSVTVYTNGNELMVKLPDNVAVNKDKIINFYGEERFNGIKTANGEYAHDGCFVALGSANAFSLAKHLGLELKDNNLVVDENMQTNIPGIYAGGDVVGGVLQIVKAAADGCKAGYAINTYLKQNKG